MSDCLICRSGWESADDVMVEERPLVLSSPRMRPLVGPLPLPATDKLSDNVIGSLDKDGLCPGLRVRCAPGVEGTPTSFLHWPGPGPQVDISSVGGQGLSQLGIRQKLDIADSAIYAWPWHAEIMVEGKPTGGTGVLVTESWVLASSAALANTK